MVILSDTVALNIAAACSMPARKLAGAAMAAASNKRLMVMPFPEVSATTVVGPLWALSAWTASLERTGVGASGTLLLGPPKLPAGSDRLIKVWSVPGAKRVSDRSCGSVMKVGFMA